MHRLSSSTLVMPKVRHTENPPNRRAHPRIPISKLAVKGIRIPHRPAATLVDLSSGGALLELPFQVPPESRFALELQTPIEQVAVPFQLLRCYVAELNGGVKYHAAGAFDTLLNLQAMMNRASSAVARLIATLERLHRAGQKEASLSRGAAEFNEELAGVIARLRRGESFDLVTLKVKARLTQAYPSLVIMPSGVSASDTQTSLSCFGLTFKSRHVLTAHARRLLRANAQLISMLEDCRGEMREEAEAGQSPQVIYSASEWVTARSQDNTHVPEMAWA
jgi:hypothetical protein